MIKEKIENEELKRLISYKCGKSFEDVTEEDIAKIYDITLNSRLINGKESGITLDILELLKGLKRLSVLNYDVSQAELETMLGSLDLDSIKFSGVTFGDVSFEKYDRLPGYISFVSCFNMPVCYPKVEVVDASGVDIDFKSIDLSQARKIIIRESIITNAHDLTDFENIEGVDLDGSRLIDEELKLDILIKQDICHMIGKCNKLGEF